MPMYEYHCEGCGKDFEEQQSMSLKAADTECPYCYTKKASRKISSFSSSIKGPNRKARSSDIKAEQAIQRIEIALRGLFLEACPPQSVLDFG